MERVGRVNLVVGRNNAGKSTLLEAVRLWASRGSAAVIRHILTAHDELRTRRPVEPSDDPFSGVLSLFYGRDVRSPLDQEIHIESPLSPASRLVIQPAFRTPDGEIYRLPFSNVDGVLTDVKPGITVAFGDRERFVPIDFFSARTSVFNVRDEDVVPTAVVQPNGVSSFHIGELWDEIALTELEERVTEALRLIAPEIDRLSVLGNRPGARIAMVKLLYAKAPVPLRSLGDGVNRLLGIALSLASARNGIALLDEFENGIHYSVQTKVWDLIFSMARLLNIQVFATTHSWDCIDAFQHAAARDSHEEAALIRLDALHDGDVRATIFDERELSVVAREQIEVR